LRDAFIQIVTQRFDVFANVHTIDVRAARQLIMRLWIASTR
jgi:hypothetical protein